MRPLILPPDGRLIKGPCPPPSDEPGGRTGGGRERTARNWCAPPPSIWCALMSVFCPIAIQCLEQGRRARAAGASPRHPRQGGTAPLDPPVSLERGSTLKPSTGH
jgi:hypothetical protein